ncbi:MAG: leucine-rich repeat protein [Lachnospiraceae bacterium]|nr:leucine-rich repeat protein [Lachnospiraceae bacterium]MBR6896648.1 leucine-rich repeat protein [Lachnospiraceae bacterium]
MKRRLSVIAFTVLAVIMGAILFARIWAGVFDKHNTNKEDVTTAYDEVLDDHKNETQSVVNGEIPDYFDDFEGRVVYGADAFSGSVDIDSGIFRIAVTKSFDEPFCMVVDTGYFGGKTSALVLKNTEHLKRLAVITDDIQCIDIVREGEEQGRELNELIYVIRLRTVASENSMGEDMEVTPGLCLPGDLPELTKLTFVCETDDNFNLSGGCDLNKVKNLELPHNIEAISLFGGKMGIGELILPEELLEISTSFFWCSNLSRIVFNEKIKTIEYCFDCCHSLKYAVFTGESIRSIEHSFNDCPDLTFVAEEGSVPWEYAKEHDIPVLSPDEYETVNLTGQTDAE